MVENKVLITGVGGFIGSHIARFYSNEGRHVFGIDMRPQLQLPFIDQYLSLKMPSEDIADIVKDYQPHLCIHCAGSASVDFSVKNPLLDFNASVLSTLNLLDAIRQAALPCKVIFLSSAAVYGNSTKPLIAENHPLNPISPYGFHKKISEDICKEFAVVYGVRTASIRIFSAYGPGLKRQVLWDICRKALNEPELILEGTGNESRDFVHVSDIVNAIDIIGRKGSFAGEIYNVASGKETLIKDLARLLLHELGKEVCARFSGNIPASVPRKWKADISKLESLGFVPQIALERGTRDYVKWVKKELLK